MAIDLLNIVQPEKGWFAILGIKAENVRQEIVPTREEADKVIQKFAKAKRDVYFGVAKFKSDASRTKENVQSLQAIWVDIDCGEAKAAVKKKTDRPAGYIDKHAGIQAVQVFCALVGLPKPLLVDSGRGIHAYWPLSEEITREEWSLIANRFRELTVLHNFYVDPAVFEAARVLRVPGTLNYKDTPPNEVKVLSAGAPKKTTPEEFREILGVKVIPKPREMSALGKLLQAAAREEREENVASSFNKIMAKSVKSLGCQQLLDCYTSRAELPEPRWTGALSIAQHCGDRDPAIHKLSKGYEGYDAAATEKKASARVGPHTCTELEKINAGGCEGCPHRGKITSPIVLGYETTKPPVEASEVEVDVEDEEGEVETHTIPEYPLPFYRGDTGGVYQRLQEEEKADIFVYEHDLYVHKRMYDPEMGDVVVMKLHLPQDGVREFVIPNTAVTDINELRKHLSKHGVVCKPKLFPFLVDYILTSIRGLQCKKKAERMRLQFGWADKDSRFIIGDREITAEGIFHSPPSSVTTELAAQMEPTGSFEEWKRIFGMYGGKGHEPHAFAALTAFGSPLLKFLGQSGAIINVIHPVSGTGKTTTLHMCNSVYGHPKGLCSTKEDTYVSKIAILGILNNLPFTVDEITNAKASEFSSLIYSCSQGKGKNRMKASSNELRANNTTWQTITLTSANASFSEKLGVLKSNPDGELMRLLEYKIEGNGLISEEEAKQAFDLDLLENYGHAGDIYIQWVLRNLEEVKATCLRTQSVVDKKLKLTQRERFWSAVVAANITGGLIAKRLGLIDWDMKAIFEWVKAMINDMRYDIKPPTSNVAAVVGDYINRHLQNILAVNDADDLRSSLPPQPLMEPRAELTIRYEPDTQRMFLATKPFREDCVESQINYKETIKELERKGIYLAHTNKRLSKGLKVAAPAVHCIVLDCSGGDFIDVDNYLPDQRPEAGEPEQVK